MTAASPSGADFWGRCARRVSVQAWVLAGSLTIVLGCASSRPEKTVEQARVTESRCSEADRERAASLTSLLVKRVDSEYITVRVGKGLGEERLVGARVAFRLPADWTIQLILEAARCSQAAFLLRRRSSGPIDLLWEPGTWIEVEAVGGIGQSQEATVVLKTVPGDAAECLLERVRAFATEL